MVATLMVHHRWLPAQILDMAWDDMLFAYDATRKHIEAVNKAMTGGK